MTLGGAMGRPRWGEGRAACNTRSLFTEGCLEAEGQAASGVGTTLACLQAAPGCPHQIGAPCPPDYDARYPITSPRRCSTP